MQHRPGDFNHEVHEEHEGRRGKEERMEKIVVGIASSSHYGFVEEPGQLRKEHRGSNVA